MDNYHGFERSPTYQPTLAAQQDDYLKFLGFQRNPFPIAPDVDHFFLSGPVNVLLTEILHGISIRAGFMVITGEVGLGKTTISQHILKILDKDTHVETALILNTFVQGVDLLDAIIRDFGIQLDGGLPKAGSGGQGGDESPQERIAILNRFLMERYEANINCVIIIDDAQNLNPWSLELIRLISNLEVNAHKLVQILLVGQTELQEKLNAHAMRQLKSRVMVHARVEPYDVNTLQQYVFFKMSSSGGNGSITIPRRSFRLLHELTQGTPRLINQLMGRVLYGLSAYNTVNVTPRLIMDVAREIDFALGDVNRFRWIRAGGAAALCVAAGIGAAVVFAPGWGGRKAPEAVAQEQAAPVQAPVVAAAPPPPVVTVSPQVQRFFDSHGLARYADTFAKSLAEGRLEEVERRIRDETGYRLVRLTALPDETRKRFQTLRYTPRTGEVQNLLFWKPSYWFDHFDDGLRSEKVLVMQKQLARLDHFWSEPDGVVRGKTTAALTRFQQKNHLPATGKPDVATLFLLNQAAGAPTWGVQVGRSMKPEEASELMGSLIQKGYKSIITVDPANSGRGRQMVQVGPLPSYDDAEERRRELIGQLNLTGTIVEYPAERNQG